MNGMLIEKVNRYFENPISYDLFIPNEVLISLYRLCVETNKDGKERPFILKSTGKQENGTLLLDELVLVEDIPIKYKVYSGPKPEENKITFMEEDYKKLLDVLKECSLKGKTPGIFGHTHPSLGKVHEELDVSKSSAALSPGIDAEPFSGVISKVKYVPLFAFSVYNAKNNGNIDEFLGCTGIFSETQGKGYRNYHLYEGCKRIQKA